jgi:hypothetical protein
LSKPIVHTALLGIGKHIVSFRREFEALLGRFISGIDIRMIFASQPPVSLLDLFRLRVSFHTEDFVVILFGHPVIANFRFPIAD